MNTRRALTLIELLVVMAILAIVAALLFASMRAGRDTSDAAQCLGNLRQLASANLRYAAENGGQYCPAQEKSNNVRWHGERSGTKEKFDPSKGPLAPHLGRDGRVKICPAFKDILGGDGSFENGTGGYGYNAIYIGGTTLNRWLGERIANVPNPARTIMFADSAMSKEEGIQEYPYAEPWRAVSPRGKLQGELSPSIHFRHNGRAHIAWCDGHVTAEKPSKLGGRNFYGGDDEKNQIGWIGPSRDNGWWNPRFVEEQ